MSDPETTGTGGGDGDAGGRDEDGRGATGDDRGHLVGLARPLVLPEPFDGTVNWDEWSFHFENVAAVNGWDDAQKLQWLRVRVTGREQKALQRLQGPAIATYEATRDSLKARFDPESRRTRYQAEFQTRRKKASEGWADFADELRSLADKAYPDLGEDARERLSINYPSRKSLSACARNNRPPSMTLSPPPWRWCPTFLLHHSPQLGL